MDFKQIKLLCLIMKAHLSKGLTFQCPTVDFHKEQTEFMLSPACVLVIVLWQIVISSRNQLTQSSHPSLVACSSTFCVLLCYLSLYFVGQTVLNFNLSFPCFASWLWTGYTTLRFPFQFWTINTAFYYHVKIRWSQLHIENVWNRRIYYWIADLVELPTFKNKIITWWIYKDNQLQLFSEITLLLSI